MVCAIAPMVMAQIGTTAALGVVPDMGPDGAYPWVGLVGGASGTAISPRSAITARHVGASQITLNGTTYFAVERINHPDVDIAILNFDTDLPVWCPLGAGAPIGSTVTMVGYGNSGNLNSGGTGYDLFTSLAVRRAVANTVDAKADPVGYGPSIISWLVDAGDAAIASGDSGGGFFVGGRLVGVSSFAINTTGGTLPNYGLAVLNDDVPYHASGAVDLTEPAIRAWVLANMSAPTCSGDINGDGFTNAADFVTLAGNFGASVTPNTNGDLNGDGIVNAADFVILAGDFGCGAP